MLCAKNQLNLITLPKTNQGGDVLHRPPPPTRPLNAHQIAGPG